MTARPLAAAVGACAGLLLFSGCGLFSHGPSPDPAATAAAHDLTTGHFARTTWTQPQTAEVGYRAAIAGMASARPTVRVGSVDTHGETATATLDWSWLVGGTRWSYTSRLGLTRSGDTWHATWSPAAVHAGLAAGGRLSWSRVPATRGDIRGAGGAPIVVPRPVTTFGLDKVRTPVAQQPQAARSLAALVGIDPGRYAKLVKAAGGQAFVPAITFRKGQVPAAVSAGYAGIRGATAVDTTRPLAPTREFAAGLLGTVGPATAEIVKKSKGRVLPGDEVGLSGLQARYDARLTGRPGVRVALVPRSGSAKTLFSSRPTAGSDLDLTLVPRLQALAERVLAGTGPASALVAIRPSSGAILAAASGPGSNGYDTATFGQYAPGSTFKIVDSLALLRAGLRPTSPVDCTTSLDVDGKTFTNDSEYPASKSGTISLTDALANSCNTAFISTRDRLHGSDLGDAAAALGFGVDHDTGFPAYFGQVPAPASEVEKAADMIGQGKVLASPMAMATVLSSVVAGHAVVPSLVQRVAVKATPPAKPLTPGEARTLRTMLRAVVTEPTGTGHGLTDVPGAPVIAKTGTAEFGTTPPLPTHAWMVAAQGDLAVAVFVDRGHTGAGVAGPLLESFLRGR